MSSKPLSIRQLDLNLLVVFQTLMEERHTSRAAAKLGLTQSAVSHALARLRRSLGDDLLIKARGGMIPTRRADKLLASVRQALSQLESALVGEETFDPLKCKQTVSISIDDYLGQTFGVDLARTLAKRAPLLKLEFRSLTERVPTEALATGTLHFAVRVGVKNAPQLFRTKLLSETYLCLTADSFKGKLSTAKFLAMEHILVAPFGGFTGSLDDVLKRLRKDRVVKISAAHFSMAPWLVVDSEYVVTLPSSIAQRFAAYLPLKIHEPPIKVPGFDVDLLWHEKDRDDPLSRWLRSVMVQITSG